MNAIDYINKAISKQAINVDNDVYKTLFGAVDFTPEAIIEDSADYNCGAICNELEYARKIATKIYKSISIDNATGTSLEAVVNSFIRLFRRHTSEDDISYRNRFKVIAVQKSIKRRTTPASIRYALSHLFELKNINIIEYPNVDYYFEVRLVGDEVISGDYMTYVDYSYIDNSYIGGIGVTLPKIYISELIDRIKAAGVDYDIVITFRDTIELTSNATITI